MDVPTLHRRSEAVASNIILQSNKPMDVIKFAIALLENFKFQTRKLDKLGYCDYSIAYVSFQTCLLATKYCSETASNSMQPIVKQLTEALGANEKRLISIERFLKRSSSDDEINQRFQSLMGSTALATQIVPEFELLQYTDFISSEQLNVLLRKCPKSILLIDFRTAKEFAYSHINFLNVLNIEPSLVSKLVQGKPDANDLDLEAELRDRILPAMLQLYQNRHKFDLVVIYNLRYGPASIDKYDYLEYAADKTTLLENSPFHSLIEILVWNNRYISSKLKQYPLILAGGMKVWHKIFRQEGLISSSVETHETKSAGLTAATPLNHTNSLPESKYVRKFNDYLSAGTPMAKLNDGAHSRAQSLQRVKHVTFSGAYLYSEGNSTNSNGFEPNFNSHPEIAKQFAKSKIGSSSDLTLTLASSGSSHLKSSALNPVYKNVSNNDIFKGLTTGLTNLGNSCYMNCILQCLVATPPLTKFFFKASESKALEITQFKDHINFTNRLGTKGAVTTTLVNLITSMLKNLGKYYTPSEFKKIIGTYSPGRQFATSEQQDCIEFLNFILDSVHEDLNKVKFESAQDRAKLLELTPEEEKNKEQLPVRLASAIEWERYLALNLSVVVDYFQGQYLSRLRCLICNLTSTTYNAFSILSLPIPERLGTQTKNLTLFDCLDFFTETELLEDDNKWHCPLCKRFTRLTKKIVITRLPSILIIHFKRFSQSGGRFKKLDTFIDYPVDKPLDLTPYWPKVATYLDSTSPGNMDVELEKEYLSSLPERNQVAPFKYKLYGVVNHFGNLTTGHYTSYIRKAGKGGEGWYYFDDSKYTPNCKVSKVLNSSAYCLFFQRI